MKFYKGKHNMNYTDSIIYVELYLLKKCVFEFFLSTRIVDISLFGFYIGIKFYD